MPTIAVSPTIPQARVRRVGSHDRVFYGSVAASMALTAIVGFAPTFYLRLFGGGPMATFGVGRPFTPLIYIHGALFTGWVALFIVQTALVSARRVAVHRRLGVGGAVLAAAMIAVATMTALAAAKRGPGPAGIPALAFLAIPLFDMIMFTTFITAALALRRNKEAHKRLMLLAYVSIMAAPAARLPGVLPLGPFAFFGIAFVFLAAGIVYDLVSRRRVHPAYIWGGTLLVASVPLRLAISGTATWMAIAQALTR
jgi:hypothetical protein